MEQKKLNKNALRSKALIKDAFISLIKEKDIKDITITDIVKRADINRATFYAHYSCVADVPKEMGDEVTMKLKSILSEFTFENFTQQPSRLLLEISKFIDKNLEYYQKFMDIPETYIFIQGLTDIFVQYIKDDNSFPAEIKNSKNFEIWIYYTAGAISTIYLNWVKGKLDCSIYDIPLQISDILMQNVPSSQLKISTQNHKIK